MSVVAADERPHDLAPGASESWTFEFALPDGSLGGFVRRTVRPGESNDWYEALVVGEHRQLLAVTDYAVPRRSSTLEVRTTGLWADHVMETPVQHWTIGLEAFALGVDDPLEVYGRGFGDQVGLGLDLEWEAVAEPRREDNGYEVPCSVHGEVLVGQEELDIDAVGWRTHRWGEIPWLEGDGWRFRGIAEGDRWLSARSDGSTCTGSIHTTHDTSPLELDGRMAVDERDLVSGGRLVAAELTIDVEPIAAAPIQVELGRSRARRPLALCRFRTTEPRATGGRGLGIGWVEALGRGGVSALAPSGEH